MPMNPEAKAALLEIVGDWLDAASEPKDPQRELRITKAGLHKGRDGHPAAVQFDIRCELNVGSIVSPISAIITPPSGIQTH